MKKQLPNNRIQLILNSIIHNPHTNLTIKCRQLQLLESIIEQGYPNQTQIKPISLMTVSDLV